MIVMTFLAAAIVFVVCAICIFHPDYHLGPLRCIALALLSLAGAARAGAIVEGGFDVVLHPIAVLLWIGLALFFVDHIHAFVRHRRLRGNAWRESNKAGAR